MSGPLTNQKHELFAWGIAQGMTGEQAYREAGYKPKSRNAADAHASRLVRNGKVKARIEELRPEARKALQTRFAERASAAFRVLDDIANSPEASEAQRVSAAKHILALAGHVPVEKVESDVTLKMNWYQRLAEEKGVTDDDISTRNKAARTQKPTRNNK